MGGVPGTDEGVARMCGYLHGDCMTVTGKTIAEICAIAVPDRAGLVRPTSNPLAAYLRAFVLRAIWAPQGALVSRRHETLKFPARLVFRIARMTPSPLRGQLAQRKATHRHPLLRYHPARVPACARCCRPRRLFMAKGSREGGAVTDGRCLRRERDGFFFLLGLSAPSGGRRPDRVVCATAQDPARYAGRGHARRSASATPNWPSGSAPGPARQNGYQSGPIFKYAQPSANARTARYTSLAPRRNTRLAVFD